MILQYVYQQENYSIFVDWHDFDGYSTIHTTAVEKLVRRHGEVFSDYRRLARELDEKTDKLYECIHDFNNEYHAVPYEAKNRDRFLQAFTRLCSALENHAAADDSEQMQTILPLFLYIQNTLQEIVGIYLADHAYQSKYHNRRRWLETRTGLYDAMDMVCEFESILIQMTDLSRMMDHLTDVQRRRLIKHIFLNSTLQEIASQEGVSKQSVQESIAAALKKLRSLQ